MHNQVGTDKQIARLNFHGMPLFAYWNAHDGRRPSAHVFRGWRLVNSRWQRQQGPSAPFQMPCTYSLLTRHCKCKNEAIRISRIFCELAWEIVPEFRDFATDGENTARQYLPCRKNHVAISRLHKLV